MKSAFVHLLAMLALSGLAFSQQQTSVFLNSTQSAKLLIVGQDDARVFEAMRANHLDSAWAEAQVLVNEDGQVIGVQKVRGTIAILSAFVAESSRTQFRPYIQSGGRTSFVALLKFKYGVQTVQPSCSLWDQSTCR